MAVHDTTYRAYLDTTQMNAKIDALNTKWDALRAKMSKPIRAGGSVRGAGGGTRVTGKGGSSQSDLSLKGMGGAGMLGFAGNLAIGAGIAYGAYSAERELVQTQLNYKAYVRGMESVSRSTYNLGNNFSFVENTAKKYGKSLSDIRETYKSFIAATSDTAIQGDKSAKIYESITRAATKLGLTQERYKLSMMAVSQIASKGCHGKGTLIRMYDGTEKKVEDIKVGDVMVSINGEPRHVLKLAYGIDELYMIKTSKGHELIVNSEHKLRVENNGNKDTVILKEYIKYKLKNDSLIHTSGENISFEIEYFGTGEYFGFLISDDHLYIDVLGYEHHNTVSMEELRQQLGESMPMALGAMAKGLGITKAKLIDLVSSGKLTAEKGLLALAKGLDELTGKDLEIDKLTASVANLDNTWLKFKENFGTGDLSSNFRNNLSGLIKTFDKGLTNWARLFGDENAFSMEAREKAFSMFENAKLPEQEISALENKLGRQVKSTQIRTIRDEMYNILKNYGGNEDELNKKVKQYQDVLLKKAEVGEDELTGSEAAILQSNVVQDAQLYEFYKNKREDLKRGRQNAFANNKKEKETDSGMTIRARAPIVYNINIAKQVGIETVSTHKLDDTVTIDKVGKAIVELLQGTLSETSIMSNNN